jgi:hypothetical protein
MRIRYLIGFAVTFAILAWWSVFFFVVLARGWNILQMPQLPVQPNSIFLVTCSR